MKTQINFISELSLRIYQKTGEEQLRGLLLEDKPLMTSDELVQHITENMGEYLNAEEQEQLYIKNLYHVDDEGIKSLLLKLAIEMAATYVQNAFENALSEKDFVGDNPYSALTAPRMFMLYKYYDEETHIKLNPDNLGEIGKPIYI
jgi:hypothetical protein